MLNRWQYPKTIQFSYFVLLIGHLPLVHPVASFPIILSNLQVYFIYCELLKMLLCRLLEHIIKILYGAKKAAKERPSRVRL